MHVPQMHASLPSVILFALGMIRPQGQALLGMGLVPYEETTRVFPCPFQLHEEAVKRQLCLRISE